MLRLRAKFFSHLTGSLYVRVAHFLFLPKKLILLNLFLFLLNTGQGTFNFQHFYLD